MSTLEERCDDLFHSLGLGAYDCQGMMRHTLDCLGALRVRIKNDKSNANDALKEVFRNACHLMLDCFIDELGNLDDVSATRFLLDAFPDEKKKTDGRGWLPLHWAAVIDITDGDHMAYIIKERPLHAQSTIINKKRSEGKMDDNIKSFNDPTDYTEDQYTSKTSSDMELLPLHFAVSLRHPRLANIQHLLNVFPSAVQMADKKGWLPIHWAAKNTSNVDVIKLLLEMHPDSVFEPTNHGQLPFQISLRNRDSEIMDTLLEANSEALIAIDNKGNTCLHDAVKYCNPYGVKKLLDAHPELVLTRNFDRDELPIHRLFHYISKDSKRLQWYQVEVLRILIEHNPETVAMTDKEGSLPIHLAVYFNSNIEIIELLVSTYPSGSLLRDNFNKLPLHYTEDPKVQRLLMGTGAAPLRELGVTNSFLKLIN
jgi:ankyrin repeat protein